LRAAALAATLMAELMAFLETYEGGRLVLHFSLCLFTEIRPDINNGEIFKLRAADVPRMCGRRAAGM
jgi:hypothetical protein